MKIFLFIVIFFLVSHSLKTSAAPIAITNPSFETGNLNGWTIGGLPNWQVSNIGTANNPVPNGTNVAEVLGFDNSTHTLTQTFSNVLAASSILTLSIDYDVRDNNLAYSAPRDFGARLYAGGNLLSLTSTSDLLMHLSTTWWYEKTVTYNISGTDPNIGNQLALEIFASGTSAQTAVSFDNVKLDVVPEASTTGYLVLSGFCLAVFYSQKTIRAKFIF